MNIRLVLAWTLFAGLGIQFSSSSQAAEGDGHSGPSADPSAPENQGRQSVREQNSEPIDDAPIDRSVRARIFPWYRPYEIQPLRPATSFTIEVDSVSTYEVLPTPPPERPTLNSESKSTLRP